MKLIFIVLSALFLLIVTAFAFLAWQSKTVPKLGLLEGRLAPCSHTRNCVNSMIISGSSGIEPIRFKGEYDDAWSQMKQAIHALGGNIEQAKDDYLWATFRSPLFSFVDDVEILMDRQSQLFNIRSASRVGHSDFSANQKRVVALQKAFIE
ncbi:MAG: DUF1499 domain-containing protein [Gammaproteobacteria bacterium]|nr:DUF1499 domain-containing protein [Gammaproteobacteria bacterium]